MVATTREIDHTGYTVLDSNANALETDITALQHEDEWTWPPTRLNKMIDTYSVKTTKRVNNHSLKHQQVSYS